MRHIHTLSKHQLRQRRVRQKIRGTQSRPRLHVFRSCRYVYAQIINDDQSKTLIGISEKDISTTGTKIVRAQALGTLLAEKAIALKISKIAFDRGGYHYHGRIKALADAARTAGLIF